MNSAYNVPEKMPTIRNKLRVDPDFPLSSSGTFKVINYIQVQVP